MGFFTTRSLAFLTASVALLAPVQAQTYTKCNPLKQSCAPDQALGTSVDIDFTSGQSSDFIASGQVSYGSDGLELSVSESNKGPYQQSKWYMMFGRVDVTMKAAPGAGVVSSFILQSDDLDEIDLEWVGDQGTTLQTNFFGKGFTGTWNRGVTYETVDSTTDFHTYTIDWSADQTTWSVDGTVLRTLTPSDFPGQYPQSPMFVKFGPWAAGDPTNNAPGTVKWADGPIQWADGPWSMYVQSITAQDYSTGTAYKYSGTSGTWESIVAIGGEVNGDGSGHSKPPATTAPSHTSTSKVPKLTTTASRSGMTTSIPSAIPSSIPPTHKSHSQKETTTKDTSSKETSTPETSTKDTSTQVPSQTHGSVPVHHTTSSPTHMPYPTYHNNHTMTTSTRKGPTGTGGPSGSATPTSGASINKQTAWVLSLACAAVGIVAFV